MPPENMSYSTIVVAFITQLFTLAGLIVAGYFALRNRQIDAADKAAKAVRTVEDLAIKVDGRLTQLLESKDKEKVAAVNVAKLEGEKAVSVVAGLVGQVEQSAPSAAGVAEPRRSVPVDMTVKKMTVDEMTVKSDEAKPGEAKP